MHASRRSAEGPAEGPQKVQQKVRRRSTEGRADAPQKMQSSVASSPDPSPTRALIAGGPNRRDLLFDALEAPSATSLIDTSRHGLTARLLGFIGAQEPVDRSELRTRIHSLTKAPLAYPAVEGRVATRRHRRPRQRSRPLLRQKLEHARQQKVRRRSSRRPAEGPAEGPQTVH